MPLLNELYQEIIIDHSTSPHNEGMMEHRTHFSEAYNATCGDELTLSLYVEDHCIQDIKFQAKGCSISRASASMMTEKIRGMDITKALEFSRYLQAILSDDNTSEISQDELGDLVALLGVKQFPMRIKCATLVWHAFEDIFKKR